MTDVLEYIECWYTPYEYASFYLTVKGTVFRFSFVKPFQIISLALTGVERSYAQKIGIDLMLQSGGSFILKGLSHDK